MDAHNEELVLVPVGTPDTIEDTRSLGELKEVVRQGLKTFMQTGKALASIRDRRLYRQEGYKTFEEFCQAEWGWGRDYADRQIQAARAVEEMPTIVSKPPQIESHVRPLTRIRDPQERDEVWQEVVKEAEAEHKPVTAARVEEKVTARLKPATEPDKPKKPDWRKAQDNFSLLLKRLHELAAGVDHAEGLAAIVSRWPESDTRAFLRQYRELGERVLRQVEDFETREGG